MSRINTNVSSLIAQTTLSRTNEQLQQSLTRLSTGLRINSGKDDPAGLIASENLRRDITSANAAISNSQQAGQLIATADSALGQISNLLNDIRGLAVQAANSGVLSDEQIAANQLQVDSSLEAIDRIAKVTTYQGRKLLDGSLDFTKSYASGGATVADLSINQANLGTAGSLAVTVNISSAASQALITDATFGTGVLTPAAGSLNLTNSSGVLSVAAAAGGAADGWVGNSTDITFQAASDIAQAGNDLTLTNTTNSPVIHLDAVAGGAADGTVGNATDVVFQEASDAVQASGTLALTGGNITITALAGGSVDGTAGNSVDVDIAEDGVGSTTASYDANTNTITVHVLAADTHADIATAIAGINGGNDFNATANTPAAVYNNADDGVVANVTSGGFNGTTGALYNSGTNTIIVHVAVGETVANVVNAINNSLPDFTASTVSGASEIFDAGDYGTNANALTGGSNGTTTANYDATANAITVQVAIGATVSNVNAAIDGLADFTSSVTSGAGNAFDTSDFSTVTDPLSGGIGAGLSADLVVRIGGSTGSEVFNFRAGTTIDQLIDAINLVSDGTGVEANNNAGVLELNSTTYGSAGFVDVEVLSEGVGGTFGSSLSGTRATGTDVVATVNGATASGRGNTLSVHTATLDLALTVTDGSTASIDFNVTGGGAVFQLGPNVVTNQQARIGIGSVNTGTIGGTDGRLYELRSGYGKDLETDPNGATLIVDEAINKITSLRGRLGAFQRTTIDTNVANLKDSVTNLTQAESQIRDADFAAETAALTRAQVLVQSGTQVLSIANQQPQNVLALLRNL